MNIFFGKIYLPITALFDGALLTDGLRSEREQGITIDVAYRYFATPKRKFIIADTPGHIQYTRNMVTGASTANLALLLVDARHGVIEQTKRHTAVLTAEDHNIIGGLSEAICQTLTSHQIAVPFQSIAVRDHFAETGSGPELYDKYGLSASHVSRAIKEVLAKKKI